MTEYKISISAHTSASLFRGKEILININTNEDNSVNTFHHNTAEIKRSQSFKVSDKFWSYVLDIDLLTDELIMQYNEIQERFVFDAVPELQEWAGYSFLNVPKYEAKILKVIQSWLKETKHMYIDGTRRWEIEAQRKNMYQDYPSFRQLIKDGYERTGESPPPSLQEKDEYGGTLPGYARKKDQEWL